MPFMPLQIVVPTCTALSYPSSAVVSCTSHSIARLTRAVSELLQFHQAVLQPISNFS